MRLSSLLLFAVLISGSAAAAYPEKPITMIIAYPPGGGTDVVGRAIAPYLEKVLGGGAKILVVNRSGAGGEVGMGALANAPADGYTIGFINTPPLSAARSASSCSATSSTTRAISPCTSTRR